MEIIDCVNIFENYYNELSESIKKYVLKEDLKYDWFAECIIGTSFYDTDISIKWGKLLYRTVKAILDNKQQEFMSENYEEYLICLQLIGLDNLEWGSSIRFCWFDKEEYIDELKAAIKQIEE